MCMILIAEVLHKYYVFLLMLNSTYLLEASYKDVENILNPPEEMKQIVTQDSSTSYNELNEHAQKNVHCIKETMTSEEGNSVFHMFVAVGNEGY